MTAHTKTSMTIRIADDLVAEMEKWIAAQPAPPARTAVIEAALRDWLAQHRPSKKP